MSLFSIARERRKTFAATPEGAQKALVRKRRARTWRAILIFLAAAFAVFCIIVILNGRFHWWTTMPWEEEAVSEAVSSLREEPH